MRITSFFKSQAKKSIKLFAAFFSRLQKRGETKLDEELKWTNPSLCSDKNNLCPQERALKYVENINTAREVSITDGISLLGSGSPRSARSYEPLAEEPKARENQVENRLIDAAADFLENHVIQLRMPKSTVDDVKRSLEEGQCLFTTL